VLLHEGLGSVSTWRDFPRRLSEETGLGVFVYSRRGYGASPALAAPFAPSFMHEEARLLPEVLSTAGVVDPIFVGHSDGGSIALLYEGPRRALVLIAAHVFVEDLTVASIARLPNNVELHDRLRKHHGSNTDALLAAWTGVWLSPEFRSWNIEDCLPRVTCPTLIIQGAVDEYGSLEQVRAIDRGVKGPVETLLLAGCGHSPHRDRPDEVLAAIAPFVTRL
jgi:pimeloyl-ACP methyl ester carboxylesterase